MVCVGHQPCLFGLPEHGAGPEGGLDRGVVAERFAEFGKSQTRSLVAGVLIVNPREVASDLN